MLLTTGYIAAIVCYNYKDITMTCFNFPEEYYDRLEFVINIVEQKQNMGGSKKYGWSYYTLPEYDLQVDKHDKYGLYCTRRRELSHPEFIIELIDTWPSFDNKSITEFSFLNNNNTFSRWSTSGDGVKHHLESTYIGDLDTFNEMFVLLNLTYG
jgi:hypothetical protein